jgi:hypothetical protein
VALVSIPESDWSLKHIRACDRQRADRLEAEVSPDGLVDEVQCALCRAIECGDFRVAVDSRDNKFVEQRAIVQFRVSRETYDWFFNARTGYRAQFWLGPDIGMAFNKIIVEQLSGVLSQCLPPTVGVRRICVNVASGSPDESCDEVSCIPRETIIRSLEPDASKIWICEQLYDGPAVAPIGIGALIAAEHDPKLCVPRWTANAQEGVTGEGLRAPYPDANQSWLDLKGGFLGKDGIIIQIKDPQERAQQIHRRGWT